LGKEDQKLIEALRVGGVIQLASWAPSDIRHVTQTAKSLISHLLRKKPLEYSGPSSIYTPDPKEGLKLNEACEAMRNPLFLLNFLMELPGASFGISTMNTALRYFLSKTDIQRELSNREIPYALRIVGGRMLKKVSLYGLMKEVSAALHDPCEYQRRHIEALKVILKYDIPYLSIIHEDDFMVSVNRHHEECEYLLARRLEKEGVEREEDLKVPVRLVLLKRGTQEVQIDPLNPHLMLMSTTREGDKLSRDVTAAVTRFVNENVAAAIKHGKAEPLPSVAKWVREQRPRLLRRRKIA